MSETKHTPGPWQIEYSTNGTFPYRIIKTGERNPIASCRGISGKKSEDTANARLIAAAPDYNYAANRFVEGWTHFLDCINFGKSNLDADAIRFMNEVPGLLQSAHNKAKGE